MMEFHDQEMVRDQTHLILKGKRTKRQKPMSPLVLTMATTISSSSSGVGTRDEEDDSGGFCELNLSCGGGGDGGGDRFTVSSSYDSVGELIQNTFDEEDMANCLILLAQGHHHQQHYSQRSSSKQINLCMNDHAKGAISEVYGCKTCNRQFPTFQALGGHRASHRKPKLALQEDNKKSSSSRESSHLEKSHTTYSNIPNINTNKSRVHECLICGAEFSSGQALGGHMRRHRPLPVAAAATAGGASSHDDDDSQEVKKSKLELLGLDLNMPAPEDIDSRGSKFSFTSQLVDCHY